MSDYRRLLVWQRAHALALGVYQVTVQFPKNETYGVVAQARRAATSVAANIAEGTGRGTQAELARFCRIARGSLNELEYHFLLARDLSYLSDEHFGRFTAEITETRRMLTGFIHSLRSTR